jgi:hypothetical protein
MEHDGLRWWHVNVIPGQPSDGYLEVECSDEDDYVAERIRQCEMMGISPLEEMGYIWGWEKNV